MFARHRWRRLHACIVCTWLVLCVTRPAHAERQHVVRPGQTLGSIAKQHGVNVVELAAANRMSRDGTLRLGQVLTVPPAGVTYVRPGQNLARIARAHDVEVDELARVNHLAADAPLRAGQRLLLPGYEEANQQSAAQKKWGAPRHPGVVTLYRVWSRKTVHLRMVDTQGKVKPSSVHELRDFLRPRLSRKKKDPHLRLIRLVAQVSDHFGGRTLQVISGYRLPGGYTRETSRHVAGEAMDFFVAGVPLTELHDYCQHFDHVGVGYYPRSHFVHLDVRRKDARWTDWSLPGQPPMLGGATAPSEASSDAEAGPKHQHRHENEADIPEPPPAEDDGQPPIDDEDTMPATAAKPAP